MGYGGPKGPKQQFNPQAAAPSTRLRGLALFAATAIAVAACGGSSATPAPSSDASAAPATEAPATPPPTWRC